MGHMGIETTGNTSAKAAGSSLPEPGNAVWFCRICGEFIHAPKGRPPRRCPTPGCTRREPFGPTNRG